MLLFRRPEMPDDFEASVAKQREAVCKKAKAGVKLCEDDFKDLWSTYKNFFWRAQRGKCGYCESSIHTHTGHIDHFYPKGAVDKLPPDPKLWGKELPFGTNVRDRICERLAESGYYWFAYTWSNYVLVCERCNSGWKRCLFPVKEEPRTLPPSPDQQETPLLLNPFEPGDEPSEHLRFGDVGDVSAKDNSVRGWETVRTYGLDRDSLREQRCKIASDVKCLLLRMKNAEKERDDRRWNDAFDDLRKLGLRDRIHAGMVRIMVVQELGESWEECFGSESEDAA